MKSRPGVDADVEVVVLLDGGEWGREDAASARCGVTAIHNHALVDVPPHFYVRFRAKDDPVKLARALKAALDRTNSQK